MRLELALPHDYEVSTDPELPSDSRQEAVLEFPPSRRASSRSNCLIRVKATGRSPWVGRFAGDYDEPPAISAVTSSGDPARVLVVCAGRGYVVNAERPQQFDDVPCYPVCGIRSVPELNLIVLSNFTDIVAYGSNGLAWDARGVVSDGLRIERIQQEILTAVGLDASTGQTITLEVNLLTGNISAGAER
jgi:hypothetical protein